jgi:hypothetical protein
MGPTSSSFRALSETILFSSFLCNRRLAIASEIAIAPIESRPDQSDCDAYPHLEAVTISKRIELQKQNKKDSEGFFQNQLIAATQNLLQLFVQELQAFEIKLYKIKWFQKQ